jgi:hypothetical protein
VIVCDDPERHLDHGRDDGGHCVALCQEAGPIGHTSTWRRGQAVRGATLPAGVLIATFSDAGRYENRTDGASHCAILIGQSESGLWVIDQWQGRTCSRRVIRFKGGAGQAVDDGDRYFTIEAA